MTTSKKAVVAFNASSTRLKFRANVIDGGGPLPMLCRRCIDSMNGDLHRVAKDATTRPPAAHERGVGHTIDQAAALHLLISRSHAMP